MRALISVNIKDGITEFARKLEEMHFEIVTAGATYIKSYVADWNVDKNNIYLCGFSAGGHLVAMYATCWKKSYRAIF